MKPLVSVIVPTYNRANFLKTSIKSIINQTYNNLEIIIVDNGSTDNTVEIVNSYTDERIRYIRLQKNFGANYARNTGIKNSSGTFLTFLDSDDEFINTKIEKELNVFQVEKSVGLVYSALIKNDLNKEHTRTSKPKYRGFIHSHILYKNVIGTPSPLIRKECFEKLGLFDENLASCQDWEMWIRISEHYKVDYVTEPLMNVLIHGSQISTDLKLKIHAYEYIINKYKQLLKDKKKLSILFTRLALFYSLNDDKEKSIKFLTRSIQLHPFKLNNFIHLLIAVFSIPLHKVLIRKYCLYRIGDIILYY